jgi:cytochrome c oxidase assembly protein subunit 15
MFVYRVYCGPRGAYFASPLNFRILTHLTSLFVFVTIIIGILTTGSGPHAGDGGASRNGLSSEMLQHFHSWPAYAATGGTLLLLALSARPGMARSRRFVIILLLIEVAQVAVGLTQARLGLPEPLVAIHMVLACALGAAMTAVVLSLRTGPAATRV